MTQARYNQISDQDHQAFVDLMVANSPENLSDDGEASPEMIQRRLADLHRQRKMLEDKVGFAVSEKWVMERVHAEGPRARSRMGAHA